MLTSVTILILIAAVFIWLAYECGRTEHLTRYDSYPEPVNDTDTIRFLQDHNARFHRAGNGTITIHIGGHTIEYCGTPQEGEEDRYIRDYLFPGVYTTYRAIYGPPLPTTRE